MSNKLIKLSITEPDFYIKFLDGREKGYDVKFSAKEFFASIAANRITSASFKINERFFSGIDIQERKFYFIMPKMEY